jgi:hypothetical protein
MKTWNFIDKSSWGDGEWQNEPDKVQWADPVTGMTCLVRRTPHHGALCGYVGVPRSHPLHGKDYESRAVIEIDSRCYRMRLTKTSNTSKPNVPNWLSN